jgi:hypothetical protein
LAGWPEGFDAIAVGCRFTIAFILLFAALPKLFATAEFEAAISNYRILPRRVVPAAARWIPRLELCGSLMLLVGFLVPVAATAMASLFASFAVAVATNLVRGREIDCGCGRATSQRPIGWDLVLGDVLLALAGSLTAAVDPDVLSLRFLIISGSGSTISSADAIAIALVAALATVARMLFSTHRRFLESAASLNARPEDVPG